MLKNSFAGLRSRAPNGIYLLRCDLPYAILVLPLSCRVARPQSSDQSQAGLQPGGGCAGVNAEYGHI